MEASLSQPYQNAPTPSGVEKALYADLKSGRTELIKRVKRDNCLLLHNYQAEVKKNLPCRLKTCSNYFQVTLIPGQILYPAYCPDHRTPHRREQNQSSTPKS